MQVLAAIKSQTRKDQSARPYMLSYYNIEAIHDKNPLLNKHKNLLARVNSAFVDRLNEFKSFKLPRYVLFIFDKDVIKFAEFSNFGIKHMLQRFVTWIQNNITAHVETRKEDLRDKNLVH